MTLGIILTTISSLFLALTVVTDKLLLGDFYHSDPRKAWFVSSFIGAILGLFATAVAWALFAQADLTQHLLTFASQELLLLGAMVFCGALVSLNLRTYFSCMSQDTMSASVAIVITATPVFVFLTQQLMYGEMLSFEHVSSLAVTMVGLIGFQLAASDKTATTPRSMNWPLIAFVFLSTAYLVLLDELFPRIEDALQLGSTQASLVAMPFYWIGFALGTTAMRHKEVRSFAKTIFTRRTFIMVILALEVIGAGFYLFEFLGLANITATLVALITGAHIVFVWIADLYIRRRYYHALTAGRTTVSILFFKMPVSNLTAYSTTTRMLVVQGCFVLITLFGLSLWQ